MFVLFIRRKIITPIRNVTDWTRLFNEGYAEMADLTFENNDEFKELYDSFNFVKKKLFEANSLIKENEDALLRLRREEEHKQKFVEKLYAEKREKENAQLKDILSKQNTQIEDLDATRRDFADRLETKELDMQMRWWLQGAIIALCGAIIGIICVYIPRPNRKRKMNRF